MALSSSLFHQRTVLNVSGTGGSRLTVEVSNNVLAIFTNSIGRLPEAERKRIDDMIQFKSAGW